jgi:hypothetical protein
MFFAAATGTQGMVGYPELDLSFNLPAGVTLADLLDQTSQPMSFSLHAAIPEPGFYVTLLGGLSGLFALRLRRKKSV